MARSSKASSQTFPEVRGAGAAARSGVASRGGAGMAVAMERVRDISDMR